MKRIIIAASILTAALVSCRANEEKDSAPVLKAKELTIKIVELTKAKDLDNLATAIRPPAESNLNRHAATSEKVKALFKDTDPKLLKFGRSFHYPEKNLIIVRIDEPMRMDLEFYFDEASEKPPRLQALHP